MKSAFLAVAAVAGLLRSVLAATGDTQCSRVRHGGEKERYINADETVE
jgi:hypothetical protein